MPQAMPGPDFAVVGVSHGSEQVMIIASKELSEAELREEVDVKDFDLFSDRVTVDFTVRRIALNMRMNSYTIIIGPTYAECFRTLFQSWTPDKEEREIEPQKGLPPA